MESSGGCQGHEESAGRQEGRQGRAGRGQEAGRDQLRHLSRRRRQGRRRSRRCAAAAEAGRLDVLQGRLRDRRRAVLEDQQRAGRPASVEAPARQGALDARELHPLAAEEVAAYPSTDPSDAPSAHPAGRSYIQRAMRLAAIDLGSNTVHLLVADSGPGGAEWRVVESDQRVTRLGEGLAASGRLGAAPAERTAAVVVEYVARARAAGAERVGIVATSAVREAANQAEFVAMLERATGERVRVISGEEEAAFTLAGVLHGLGGPLDGSTLLFDIGGGSTEYLVARAGAAVAAVSLRLGVVDLAERYPFPVHVDRARYQALQDEVAGR